MTTRPKAYIILAADYGNIGDALIYRQSLSWFDGRYEVHANVGQAPKQWLDQLGLNPAEHRIYGSRGAGAVSRIGSNLRWMLGAIFGGGKRALVFDCGETPLRSKQLPKELVLLGVTAAARLFGATVVRPPHAIRANPHKATLAVYRAACRLTHFTFFRNADSLELAGTGELLPDLGFGVQPDESATGERNRLTITMRGERDFPDQEWIAGVAEFASKHELVPTIVTQVSHDLARDAELAVALGAEDKGWNAGDLVAQEAALRDVYRESQLVISDRMHVLVYSLAMGAVPAEVVDRPSAKIRTHFAVAGLDKVSFDQHGRSREEVTAFLDATLADAASDRSASLAASRTLREASDRVYAAVGGARAAQEQAA